MDVPEYSVTALLLAAVGVLWTTMKFQHNAALKRERETAQDALGREKETIGELRRELDRIREDSAKFSTLVTRIAELDNLLLGREREHAEALLDVSEKHAVVLREASEKQADAIMQRVEAHRKEGQRHLDNLVHDWRQLSNVMIQSIADLGRHRNKVSKEPPS